MDIYKKESLSEMLSLYFKKRMARIFLLGTISGFPWILIGTSLTLWLRENDFSRTDVGLFSLIFVVYGFNFLWAPLIDRLRIPWLTNKIGHRRGWIVTMQLIILLSLLSWGITDPKINIWLVAFIGLIIASASATQDIVVDALRIEQVRKTEGQSMSAGAGVAVIGWFTGYKIGGIIALFTADYFQSLGFQNYWQITFVILTAIIIACNIGLMFIPEQQSTERQAEQKNTDQLIIDKLGSSNLITRIIAWMIGTVIGPFISFFKSKGIKIALYIIIFLFLFKIGEAFLGKMSVVFYDDMGFSKKQIGIYSKGFGWIITVVFTLVGSLFSIRSGVVKGMFIAGILMASTNLLFSVLAWYGKSELLFATAVILDEITSAISTVVFVVFISLLVDRTYTATHYALMASVATFGKNVFSSFSGFVVDKLEFLSNSENLHNHWAIFFIITAVMVIPSLIFLWFIKNKLKLQ
jgi:MFS transporter, PAT family, beta-lactamase induction signal transducer AmpG